MFKRCVAACAAMAFLLGAAEARAQSIPLAGTVEIGAFGQWTWFDENAGRLNAVPEDGIGYGGRLGYFFTERFQLEADGYYSPQDRSLTDSFCCTGAQPTQIDATGFALRLNYNHPLAARSQFIVGLGGVRTNYKFRGGTQAEDDIASFGVSGLAGLRVGIMDRVALRIDGVVDHMPNHEPDANTNLHARAGLSLLLGGAAPVPAVVPPPAPAPAPTPPPAAPAERQIQVCVIQDGQVQNVTATFRPATGDTVIGTQPFRQVHPAAAPSYAAGATWFIQTDTMVFRNTTWVRFGLPRVIQPAELQRVGEIQGTPIFAQAGRTAAPAPAAPYDVVYVPVRPGCEFQPYQPREAIRPRG
jgi:hypothetical protein